MKKNSKESTTVATVLCPNCADLVYSCHVHHFNVCSCRGIFVDGGFDYFRYGIYKPLGDKETSELKVLTIVVPYSKKELTNQYLEANLVQPVGIIKKEDRKKILGKMWNSLFLDNNKK
jgi:hypothetical protein